MRMSQWGATPENFFKGVLTLTGDPYDISDCGVLLQKAGLFEQGNSEGGHFFFFGQSQQEVSKKLAQAIQELAKSPQWRRIQMQQGVEMATDPGVEQVKVGGKEFLDIYKGIRKQVPKPTKRIEDATKDKKRRRRDDKKEVELQKEAKRCPDCGAPLKKVHLYGSIYEFWCNVCGESKGDVNYGSLDRLAKNIGPGSLDVIIKEALMDYYHGHPSEFDEDLPEYFTSFCDSVTAMLANDDTIDWGPDSNNIKVYTRIKETILAILANFDVQEAVEYVTEELVDKGVFKEG